MLARLSAHWEWRVIQTAKQQREFNMGRVLTGKETKKKKTCQSKTFFFKKFVLLSSVLSIKHGRLVFLVCGKFGSFGKVRNMLEKHWKFIFFVQRCAWTFVTD